MPSWISPEFSRVNHARTTSAQPGSSSKFQQRRRDNRFCSASKCASARFRVAPGPHPPRRSMCGIMNSPRPQRSWLLRVRWVHVQLPQRDLLSSPTAAPAKNTILLALTLSFNCEYARPKEYAHLWEYGGRDTVCRGATLNTRFITRCVLKYVYRKGMG